MTVSAEIAKEELRSIVVRLERNAEERALLADLREPGAAALARRGRPRRAHGAAPDGAGFQRCDERSGLMLHQFPTGFPTYPVEGRVPHPASDIVPPLWGESRKISAWKAIEFFNLEGPYFFEIVSRELEKHCPLWADDEDDDPLAPETDDLLESCSSCTDFLPPELDIWWLRDLILTNFLDGLPGVYFARMKSKNFDYVKIGVSSDIGSRIRSLQTGSAIPIWPYGAAPGAERTDEAALHGRFAANRVSHEWFALDRDLSTFLAHDSFSIGERQDFFHAGIYGRTPARELVAR